MRAVVKSLVDRAKNLYNASEMQQELNKINSSKKKKMDILKNSLMFKLTMKFDTMRAMLLMLN